MLITKTVIRYGVETPVEQLGPAAQFKVEVQCPVCGEIRTVRYVTHMRSKNNDMCPQCVAQAKRHYLEPGTKFGRLTVLGPSEQSGYSVCRCECGHVGDHRNSCLTEGKIKSCGCLQRDWAKKHITDYNENVYTPEKHPRWRGGITTGRAAVECKEDYKRFRDSIIERDGNKCVICGSPTHLLIHHLVPAPDALDQMMNPDNVVTLCPHCHRTYHDSFCRKNNLKASPETFKQYAAENGVIL